MRIETLLHALRLADSYGMGRRGRVDSWKGPLGMWKKPRPCIAFTSQPDRGLHEALLEAGWKFASEAHVYYR